jgi:hypothetical protein
MRAEVNCSRSDVAGANGGGARSSSLSALSISHCVSRRSSASSPQMAARRASRSLAGKSSSSCASACARR